MCALSADWKRRRLQVSDRYLEDSFISTMVYRALDVELRHAHVRHNFRSIDPQLIVVLLALHVVHVPAHSRLGQPLVVLVGLVKDGLVVFLAHVAHLLGVAGDRPGLVERVPVIRYGWIQKKYDPDKHSAGHDDRQQIFPDPCTHSVITRYLYYFCYLKTACLLHMRASGSRSV